MNGRGGRGGAPSNGGDDGHPQAARHAAIAELDAIARSLDLEGRMERHPYVMVAATAGLGFVLGGGLFRPFASRLIRTGLRLALIPLAEQVIARLLSPPGAREAT